MTKVRIDSGACGFQTYVEIRAKDAKTFSVLITSDCDMVKKLGRELAELTLQDAFTRITDNPVFIKSSACLKHVACPVPCGILKALEVEAGLNVRKDPAIHFVADEEA